MLKTTSSNQQAWDALRALDNQTLKPLFAQHFRITVEGDRTLKVNLASGKTRMCSRSNVDKLMDLVRNKKHRAINRTVNGSTYIKFALVQAGILI